MRSVRTESIVALLASGLACGPSSAERASVREITRITNARVDLDAQRWQQLVDRADATGDDPRLAADLQRLADELRDWQQHTWVRVPARAPDRVASCLAPVRTGYASLFEQYATLGALAATGPELSALRGRIGDSHRIVRAAYCGIYEGLRRCHEVAPAASEPLPNARALSRFNCP